MSGFLLGYVAMLPLIGRIADLRGRTPVLVAALVVFAFGGCVYGLSLLGVPPVAGQPPALRSALSRSCRISALVSASILSLVQTAVRPGLTSLIISIAFQS